MTDASTVPVQVDLGNLAVGVATVIVAFVTLWVSISSIKAQNRGRVAEHRVAWVNELRSTFSQFIGTVYSVTNEVVSAEEEKRPRYGLDKMHSDLMRLEAQLKLFMNPEEALHASAIEQIAQLRGKAAALSIKSDARLHLEIDGHTDKLVHYAKLILKKEWDRAKNEINGN